MKNYFSNWNILRVLRLALGIVIVIQGIRMQEWMLAVMGALFALMPVLNIGCCGTAGCRTPAPKAGKPEAEDTVYEEVR